MSAGAPPRSTAVSAPSMMTGASPPRPCRFTRLVGTSSTSRIVLEAADGSSPPLHTHRAHVCESASNGPPAVQARCSKMDIWRWQTQPCSTGGLGDSNSNIGTSCTESCSRLRAARPGDCNLGALPLLLPCGSGAAEVHEFRVHLVYRRLPACKGSGTRLVPTEPCWRLPVCISRTWNWLSAQSGSALLLGRQVSAYADQGLPLAHLPLLARALAGVKDQLLPAQPAACAVWSLIQAGM